jgi:hypothetical protein
MYNTNFQNYRAIHAPHLPPTWSLIFKVVLSDQSKQEGFCSLIILQNISEVPDYGIKIQKIELSILNAVRTFNPTTVS